MLLSTIVDDKFCGIFLSVETKKLAISFEWPMPAEHSGFLNFVK